MNRVPTALALIAFFAPTLFFAPAMLWLLLVALVAGVAAHEWARISAFPKPASIIYAAGMSVVVVALGLMPDVKMLMLGLFALAAAFWILVAPLWLVRHWRAESVFLRALTGTLVMLPTWAALLVLRERSPWLLLGVLAVVWLADISAYYAGRKFGKHKLAPSISPGKSWEGVAGAGLALFLYASAISAAIHGLRIPGALILVVVLLYFSVLGDLFESWMKRLGGVKDSGTLLPGHGGVLDRIDALTAALPIAAGILHFSTWAR
jgi:phosphatidate cytidylyltransferase